jgi:hypothetical protein
MSENLPLFFITLYPMVSAESSITFNLYFFAISMYFFPISYVAK